MRKLIAIILTIILLAGCFTAVAEVYSDDRYETLTVGVTTAFSGNFLSDALGSNISDQDVRKLIHAYSLVRWDSEIGAFRMNHLHPPFDNPKIRQAVLMGMNQEDYMRSLIGDDDKLWKPLPGFWQASSTAFSAVPGAWC